jgi:hypothetical protein
MNTMTESEVLEEIERIVPNLLRITKSELKTWTYCGCATVMSKAGVAYKYASRRFIPDNLKVDGRRAYYREIIPFLLRLKELQLLTLSVEEIQAVLEIERKTGKRVALCRDCGANLGYLVDPENDHKAVCDKCAEKVVYNHK